MGLSNNEVTSFFQDDKGLMWMGTYDGLNRYDGYKFTSYRSSLTNDNSLVNNRINCITQDRSRRLWIGTINGASQFDMMNSRFSSIHFRDPVSQKMHLLEGNVYCIKEVPGQEMLIASEKEGMLVYGKTQEFAVSVPLFHDGKAIFGYNAASLSVDTQANIWVLVRGVGLCRFDRSKKGLEVCYPAIKHGIYLTGGRLNDLWIAADNGLYHYSISKKRIIKKLLPGHKINHLTLDHNNTLWIGTDGNGVFTVDQGAHIMKRYLSNEKNPLLTNAAVHSIFEDRENRKWIGTVGGGMVVIDPNKLSFQLYSHHTDKNTNPNVDFILSFCEDEDRNLWVGTDGGGIRKWDRKRSRFTTIAGNQDMGNSPGSNFVTNIKMDRFNNIWCSTWGGGVNRYNRRTGRFVHYALFNPKTRENDRFAWMIYEDKFGKIWVSACNNGALYWYNPQKDRFELFDSRLTNILSFGEDNSGNFWVGTFTSLIKVDRQDKTISPIYIGHPVRSIHEDTTGRFWIGTENGGLLQFDRNNNTYHRFTDMDGLPSNAILNILEDDNGELWVSTYNGISRFNPSSRKFTNYTRSDGLQSNQFNYNAALILKSGEFVFGGRKGFNVFDPGQISLRPRVAQGTSLQIEGLRINNTPVFKDAKYVSTADATSIKKVTIPNDEAVISFDLLKPEYSTPDKIRYAYRLKGLDKDWNFAPTARSVNYAGLPPGTYFFEAKSTNQQGEWGESGQLLEIVILPPWYKTWWAHMLFIGLGIILLIAVLRYNAGKRESRYKILLANLEIQKEKELHEKRLSFFTSISHEFRTPLTLILGPVKELLGKTDDQGDLQELNTVHRNARRLLSLVNQLLLLGKAESGLDKPQLSAVNFYQLCEEVYSYFLQQAKYKNIDYQFSLDNKSLQLEIDREKMEIALFNVLSNAVKFTPKNGKIRFNVVETGKMVEITVSDSGCGIEADVGDKLFENFYQVKTNGKGSAGGFGIGLYLTRKFIEQHNGRVVYNSTPGEGTTFHISLKKNGCCINHGNDHTSKSVMLDELHAELESPALVPESSAADIHPPHVAISEKKTLLIVDDDPDIRAYIRSIVQHRLIVYEAGDGSAGLVLAEEQQPDIIITDISMPVMSGLDMCRQVKENDALCHIPIVMLTANTADETRLKSMAIGADEYIAKPFDRNLLVARLDNILENRSKLRRYFFDTITLQKNSVKVPAEFKDFLERCIKVVENNLDRDDFTVQTMAKQMGMSHSNLYKKVRYISGMSVSNFIRSIRLRKAAELMLKDGTSIKEAAFEVGISDSRYFREQFSALFGMRPSEYIKKYRNIFNQENSIINRK